MADRSYQSGTADQQSTPSELVKSMAISSAELWHEVLDRLTQVQQSQTALARSIDDLGSIIKSALPALAEAGSAPQTLPPPIPQQSGTPTPAPRLAPTAPQTGLSALQPPPAPKQPISTPIDIPVPGAPLGGASQNPFMSQAPSAPPPGHGMPAAPPTPPSAPQQIAPPKAGMPSSPTEVPEPLFFVPPLAVQAADADGISTAIPATPPVPPATGGMPSAPVPSKPIPSQTAAPKAGVTPPPAPPAMPSTPASTSLPEDVPTKPSTTAVKPAEPVNIVDGGSDDVLDAILAAEFSDSGLATGHSLGMATSTLPSATIQPAPQIAGDAQLDALLGKEFSAAPTGMAPSPAPVPTKSPEPPATVPTPQPGFQVSPASILAEPPRQQAPYAAMPQTPAPTTQGLSQMPHLSAPPTMMPLPTHLPIPEAPPETPAREEATPKSIVESLPKIEKPTILQPLPVTPGMPPPAMGFEIPEPMLAELTGRPAGADDSDAFNMAKQIQEASPVEPAEEEHKEAPISEDIVLGQKHKKASRFFKL